MPTTPELPDALAGRRDDDEALVVVDHAGSIVLMTPAAEELFGVGLDDVAGEAMEVFMPQEFRFGHQAYRRGYLAEPAIAASTWSQSPCLAVTAAIASMGSSAVVAVVPVVATTAQGTAPAARSRSIAASSSSAHIAYAASCRIRRTFARPNPASSAALSTEL